MPIKATIQKARVPIKIWSDLEKVEAEAIQQLTNTANLPFVFKHVAVMPDVHVGIGATVGSVIATKNAICPAAVGVDIGCGMMAVKTKLDAKRVEERTANIRAAIERAIPVGFDQNTSLASPVLEWAGWEYWKAKKSKLVDKDLFKKAQHQLGSLGGGNHFIEVCLDTERNVWVLLHSGSRGVGNSIAQRYIENAKDLMKKLSISLPDPNLAYFAKGQKEFANYLADLTWCQAYAFENRQEMMRRVLEILSALFEDNRPLERSTEVNCHHNYVESEKHFGQNVLVTRKGAVRARQGDLGIIPGSMGTRSYIVVGKGNTESFQSCSHGAGRVMSRTQAKKQFTLKDLKAQTEGVDCRKDKAVIDEIPGAYKSIEEVMKNQEDLVEIQTELKQILCVKG